jgi:PIN domain
MAKLKTKNVFIDTEVFDAANLNFQSTTFKELVKLVQAGYAKVFITEVTKSEVETHIAEKSHEAALHLKRLRKEQRFLRNVASCNHLFEDFDKEGAISEVRDKFDGFLHDAAVTVLNLEGTDAGAIFESYFQQKPPFGTGKKKYEFPDAFAQHAVGKWCNEHNCEMYVVSADGDWQSTDVKGLIPLHKLQEFIDAAVNDYNEEQSARAMMIYEKNIETIKAEVKKAFGYSGFITRDVDGEVEGVEVTRLELDDPQLLEVDDNSATISVAVDLDYKAEVSYEDPDEGIWDSEDHVWVYRPTRHAEVEESENFDAELSIQFDPNNDAAFEVSCSVGKDFSVRVLPSEYDLK